MPRAEVGSTKYLNNKLKSVSSLKPFSHILSNIIQHLDTEHHANCRIPLQKGLQRLRWYCQVCEKQCRDENGFKCHTQSESHVRAMLSVGDDPRSHIRDYSDRFQQDFITLLRTSHREKKVHVNRFYQEYIADKEHVHMNATRWHSLTEFAAHLGRQGICRVEEEEEDGLFISWIDNSPEALRRQDALKKKERQDKGDELLEQRLIREQVERAKGQAQAKHTEEEQNRDTTAANDAEQERKLLKRENGEKIVLNLSSKHLQIDDTQDLSLSVADGDRNKASIDYMQEPTPQISLSKNVLTTKKNVFGKQKSTVLKQQQPKKISEVERIMKQELERKRTLATDASLKASNVRRKLR